MDQNEPCAKSDVFFHMLGLMISDKVKKGGYKEYSAWNSTTVILLPSSPSGDRFLRFLKEVNLTGSPSSALRRKSVEILIPIKIFSLPIFSYLPSTTKNQMKNK